MDAQQQDMADYFDFHAAAMPDAPPARPQPDHLAAPRFIGSCLLHPHDDGCLCNGSTGPLEVPDPLVTTAECSAAYDMNNDWTMNFSSYISRYQKPETPCDYCRLRQLECFKTFEGQTGCSPCNALFRTCSFSKPEQLRGRSRNELDTLHLVQEDTAEEFGGLTGTKTLAGYKADEERTARRSSTRFPRAAIKVLTDWIVNHSHHPYPTEEEKEDLGKRTGLTDNQVNNWLANARRRKKHKPKRGISPSISSPNAASTPAIDIPASKTWTDLNPMERWMDSPPENEPAPLTAIAQAIRQHTPPRDSCSSGYNSRNASTGSSGQPSLRAPSTASLEIASVNSGLSSQDSSFGSVWSSNSRNSGNSFGSFGSLNSLGSGIRKDRRRRRRPEVRAKRQADDARVFQCTFCTDTFKNKYDWSRHEKSLHLSLEKWICAPLGPVITCSASGQKKCVFCDAIDPSQEHLEDHNWSTCEEKGPEGRTFYRKDHLRQHMRLMHNCKLTQTMESWKSETTYIRSRCGFCRQTFDTWQDRVDHLAKEFRNGANMKDWKGCRGFDPQVALLITNAMPPYLIAGEAKTPNPFKASEPSSLAWHTTHSPAPETTRYDVAAGAGFFQADVVERHPQGVTDQGDPINPLRTSRSLPPQGATCWEVLTVRLGRYAKQQVSLGIHPSDAMLQREARRILFNEDDGWEQTAADNPEWLKLFKKAHGLTYTPADFDQADALEDLGMLGDLRDHPMCGDDWYNTQTSIPATECADTMGGTLTLSEANMMLGGPATCWANMAAMTATATAGGGLGFVSGTPDFEGLDMRVHDLNGFPGIGYGGNSAP
ncbi:uncharacterized protein K452DRAFT_277805 [Aplosporella prunicola CBS 121167]|uniref:Homeobox domain-containing protein n=1 Tax=Aplosporella prunicola CBS 121167 TaxID=1176127 RepID=A0A6A6B3X4_9PEZI|nr:uncharacterized protein K452DRAFT_277805 [Aplosporella prunicola CBS 121167]KAF2138073.1 hypothetical protein K452DRAFT_277805 [Aplosporella prunicola CBS 121167]